jgi:ABC-type phosphate/phosphonate transport system substrate-binding protein
MNIRAFSALLSLILTLSAAPAVAANAPLVLGSYAYPSLDRTLALTPLAGVVEAAAGAPVEIRLYKDPDAIAAALAAGEVDVAVLNLGAWLRAARTPGLVPLATLVPSAEVHDRYRAVLLARPGLGMAQLGDVVSTAPGLRLAAVLRGSTSGGLVQIAALGEAAGGAPPGLTITYAGSHEAALAMILDGKADLAALAETPWRTWLAASGDSAAKPVAIWRSQPLPSGPVVCRPSPRIDCARLGAALFAPGDAPRAAAQGIARGWPELAGAEQFAAYDEARYAGLIAVSEAGETEDQRPAR